MASFVQVLLHSEVISKITAVSVDENLSKISYHDIAKTTNTHSFPDKACNAGCNIDTWGNSDKNLKHGLKYCFKFSKGWFSLATVVIRSAERYHVMKVKPMESVAKHAFRLWLRRLRSNELNCCSRKQKWKNKPSIILDSGPYVVGSSNSAGQYTFHWIISNVIKRNENILILPTPILSNLSLRFSIFDYYWVVSSFTTPTPSSLWPRFSIFTGL